MAHQFAFLTRQDDGIVPWRCCVFLEDVEDVEDDKEEDEDEGNVGMKTFGPGMGYSGMGFL